MFWRAWFALFRAEGFFSSLVVLQWRPRDKMTEIFDQKFFFFQLLNCTLWSSNSWIGIRIGWVSSSWIFPASFPDYFDEKGKFSWLFSWMMRKESFVCCEWSYSIRVYKITNGYSVQSADELLTLSQMGYRCHDPQIVDVGNHISRGCLSNSYLSS